MQYVLRKGNATANHVLVPARAATLTRFLIPPPIYAPYQLRKPTKATLSDRVIIVVPDDRLNEKAQLLARGPRHQIVRSACGMQPLPAFAAP